MRPVGLAGEGRPARRRSAAGTEEAWSVALLAAGSGLVGLDRYMLLPVFPILRKTFHLDYQQVGMVVGSLAMTYGLSALIMGWLSDRIGRMKVVVGSAVVFSLLVGLTGFANGLASLCALRAMMGVADGGFMTSSIAASIEVSAPARHGRNLGIQLMMIPLVGLALCPIVITQLLHVISWRLIFFLITPFGFATSFGLYRVLKTRDGAPPLRAPALRPQTPSRWIDLFRYRNVRVCMAGMVCWLTVAVSLSTMLPNYLVESVHLSTSQMGLVLAATGLGGACGNLVLPYVSDRIGRKSVALLSAAGAIAALLVFSHLNASPPLLFSVLFVANFFIFALVLMTVGPSVGEAVPPQLRASATGLVLFTGEILGGGVGPILSGYVASHFGIGRIFAFVTAVLGLGFVLFLFLNETAPRGSMQGAPKETGVSGEP